MVALVRIVTPSFIRKSVGLKFFLTLLIVGGIIAGGGFVMAGQPALEGQFVLSLVGAIGVMALVGGLMGRRVSTSLAALSEQADEVAEGNLDAEIEATRIDRVGRMAQSLEDIKAAVETHVRVETKSRQDAQADLEEARAVQEALEDQAREYGAALETFASGDFTTRLDPDPDNEAMADLATAFNEAAADLEATTQGLEEFITTVLQTSRSVGDSGQSARETADEVTEAVTDIAEGAETQSEQIEATIERLEALSDAITEITTASNEVADIAAKTTRASNRGQKAANEAIEGMREIEDESEQAVEEIQRLEDEMNQIDELIEFITEVAEQTNMLALNANIEAARSGGSEEGFSVVAGEVKDLAEETKYAAEDIEERLERIQEQTERAATEVEKASARVTDHTDAVADAAEAFGEVAEYSEETSDGIEEVVDASEAQSGTAAEVIDTVAEVGTIADETVTESKNVSSATQEQSTSLASLTANADALADQAADLSSMLEDYQTDSDEDILADFDTIGGDVSADAEGEGEILDELPLDSDQ